LRRAPLANACKTSKAHLLPINSIKRRDGQALKQGFI
jgi:hypothetical protein